MRRDFYSPDTKMCDEIDADLAGLDDSNSIQASHHVSQVHCRQEVWMKAKSNMQVDDQHGPVTTKKLSLITLGDKSMNYNQPKSSKSILTDHQIKNTMFHDM
jgi:hypothetical protein